MSKISMYICARANPTTCGSDNYKKIQRDERLRTKARCRYLNGPKSGEISSGPGINETVRTVGRRLWVATFTQLCWARERNDRRDAPARRQTTIRPTYVIANTCTWASYVSVTVAGCVSSDLHLAPSPNINHHPSYPPLWAISFFFFK